VIAAAIAGREETEDKIIRNQNKTGVPKIRNAGLF